MTKVIRELDATDELLRMDRQAATRDRARRDEAIIVGIRWNRVGRGSESDDLLEDSLCTATRDEEQVNAAEEEQGVGVTATRHLSSAFHYQRFG